MKRYKGYLIDLDGTMYRGTEKIEEASAFINLLATHNIPYLFVTNNSTKTQDEVAHVLKGFDILAEPSQVFTSSMAAARFITAEIKQPKVFVIGERGLEIPLQQAGCILTEEEPDAVVMGLDREITYEKLAKGSLAVRNGAAFIVTNSDTAFPTERGFVPGNGALSSVITVSTGVTPTFIGKPEPIMVEQALDLLGVSKEDVLLVGDNYHTDIQAGIRAGVDTLLVHTGVTTAEDLKQYEIQPTYSVQSLKDWTVF
ncbi:MAG TPA: TIGR01457 family HAD-type hydrolase [Bacillus sp. (in: firmicutes)]|uniref:TIGR01457 family HAD-type hydrolase n=1 Tax=Bacillus litorisediminis TaxID=2922713 RepID=UPI001FAC7740|nr:TIGR01457 family HAD-type hydrolase [Bacillus litorisediminis]HWO77172.1 TIGR01457 family HAD-type hydrolase [Bacillus sp. (in: firmicutes)]